MRRRFWPRSLAARTALVLLAGLAVVQIAGLTIHALDRIDLQRLGQARDLAVRLTSIYRTVVLTPPADRQSVLREAGTSPGFSVTVSPGPPTATLSPSPQPLHRLLRVDMNLVPVPPGTRPREFVMFGGPQEGKILVGMRMPDGDWLNVWAPLPPLRPWHSRTFLGTVLDEAGDSRPEVAADLCYEGPPHLTVRARPLSLKRALTNLVANAVNYGSSARVRLRGPHLGLVTIEVEDDGPGIPPSEIDRVFEPFHRLESSRNRETGGVGLGLPIARNILRAHGGDVMLRNRAGGGARAIVTLPA